MENRDDVKGTGSPFEEIKTKKTPDLSFSDIIDLETLQKIQDSFAYATGVASLITDPKGNPITQPSNFCRLCRDIIRKTEIGLANCMHSDAEIGIMNPHGPVTHTCLSSGLWDGGATITAGNRHIANWLIGQVRNEEISKDEIIKYADVIGADREEFSSALDEVNVMSPGQFRRVCEALFIIATQISDLAYRKMALEQSEKNLNTTLDSIGEAVITTDHEYRITKLNPVAENITGWKLSEASGRLLPEVFSISVRDTGEEAVNPAAAVLESGRTLSVPSGIILTDRSGNKTDVAYNAAPVNNPDGSISGVIIIFRDESTRILLEEQLRQSQKMEAIGRLAGGIAHDFNNMLGGIRGAAEMLYKRHRNDTHSEKLISIILEAVERASSLTRQMLDFSRKGKKQSVPVDMHNLISGTAGILERSVDKKVRITTDFRAEDTVITGDPAQLQSTLLNLGINARDSMPGGGDIRISSVNIDVDERHAAYLSPDLVPGRYIEVSISDTGTGIPHDIQKRIFDPFFTTKEPGKGTGLGLSAVYGTVKDHRGVITVYSEPGTGSVFKIYLPVTCGIEVKPVRPEICYDRECTIGRVLLVDDEPLLRNTGRMILEDFGNDVITADDGARAVELFRAGSRFDLVIMDIIMPNMNGIEAYNNISMIDPAVPFIFASGFTYRQNIQDLMTKPNVAEFIQKPYSISSLGSAITRILRKKNPYPVQS
jgi:PAS domain S-box-containing protein